MTLVFYGGLTGLGAIKIEMVILSAIINIELTKKVFVEHGIQLVMKNSSAAKLFRISTIAKNYTTHM